ncbi:MAG: putative binding protein [Cyanobacteria bacterium RYN_339]|nr:putative binding protein [Cyanobacteria bacterium RYN_339]
MFKSPHPDHDHLFERLRNGTTPERALDAIAVGLEEPLAELDRLFALVGQGEGVSKFLRGGYGCGKTFLARYALQRAHQRNLATSFVVVSVNDAPLYKFDVIYQKILEGMTTRNAPRHGLRDILDRWIAKSEDAVIDTGVDEKSPGFVTKVLERFEVALGEAGRVAGPLFMQAIRAYARAVQMRDHVSANGLLAWISGSKDVGQAVLRPAGLKGVVETDMALNFLRGILEIIRLAGHPGLFVVVDEVETVMRMPRKDLRGKSLNAIRQLLDKLGDGGLPGLMLVFTGTPEFYDAPRGVRSEVALDQRIAFKPAVGGFVNYRQPQLELRPFDAERLRAVGRKLRDIYPAADAGALKVRVSEAFLDRLVSDVLSGCQGHVGVAPRAFLRELVGVLDLADQHPTYDPLVAYAFEPASIQVLIEQAATGEPLADDDDRAVGTSIAL